MIIFRGVVIFPNASSLVGSRFERSKHATLIGRGRSTTSSQINAMQPGLFFHYTHQRRDEQKKIEKKIEKSGNTKNGEIPILDALKVVGEVPFAPGIIEKSRYFGGI